jgi:hypothetical protein
LGVVTIIAGWWFQPTPLKNDGVKVSWDDDIPNRWKNNIHVPNHQPDSLSMFMP